MSSRSVLAVALGAIVIAACGSGAAPTIPGTGTPYVVPTPSMTSTPTPSPPLASSPSSEPTAAAEATVRIDWTTYTSERYSYAVDYPTDWLATPAVQDWPSNGDSYPTDSAVDKWALPPTNAIWVLMFISSVPLGEGQTPTERIAKLDADNAAQLCELANRRGIVIEEVTARQEHGMRFGSDYINQVAVVNAGRFYLIWLLSASPFTATSLATFDHFVGSFRFL